MDTTEAIITHLFETLRDDTELKDVLGSDYHGPLIRVPPDTMWPFLKHNMDSREGVDLVTRPGTYQVEVWDYGETLTRVWDTRARLMALLDNTIHRISGQGALRLWFTSETMLPNEDTNVMTLALVFTIRYARSGEVRAGITTHT